MTVFWGVCVWPFRPSVCDPRTQLPVFERCHGLFPPEHPTEVLQGAEPGECGHAGGVELGAEKQVPSPLETQRTHVVLEGHALSLDEQLRKMDRRKTGDTRDARKAQGLRVMLLDVIEGDPQPPIPSRRNRPPHRLGQVKDGRLVGGRELADVSSSGGCAIQRGAQGIEASWFERTILEQRLRHLLEADLQMGFGRFDALTTLGHDFCEVMVELGREIFGALLHDLTKLLAQLSE